MTTIRATCPDCGDVVLTTADVTVRRCVDTDEGSYRFRCPHCELTVTKTAPRDVVDVLLGSGVALEEWSLPAELAELRDGPELTMDDLLAFHELLDRQDWFDTLLEAVHQPPAD
ncbi:MAG: hypothetical protein KAZ88_01020 [Acidimicrobiia bacterium]|jgi:predicted RNA-binding Zn-ribbon protein involved in translation (DUF1610 family)|nr:hypothetical protein [Acidimicrobiia bacterium]MBP8179557.1 hypothetical protein [Acidimicrobiia bacterium]